MSNDLLETVLVPVASEDDAERTCEAILREIRDERPTVHVVHVIEKAGGAPDKASVEQREERAERIFDVVEASFADAPIAVSTDVVYGTDVAEAILDEARRLDATAVVLTPRYGSRLVKLLTGDVAQKLMSNTEHPLVILPRGEDHE